MSQEENPALPDDSEEDQQSSNDWEHVPSQEEGFRDESQGEVPTYTTLVPAEVSQYNISMSSQPGTSSQYQSHDESIGDLIDEVLKEDSGVLKENSGDAESFSALDISSKSHSHEESQPSVEDAAQDEYAVFRASIQSVIDAMEQKG